MSRKSILLAGISKTDMGLEIAPYHSPLASKADGYNCQILDVFDTERLRENALADPLISNERIPLIEKVDFVGSATDIEDLVPQSLHGSYDYILSSHNFEHLANPIRFLQGCEKILKPGGRLILAVPDMRATFDYFRPHTELSEWLGAYRENRTKPTAEQVFSLHAYLATDDKGRHTFRINQNPDRLTVRADLEKLFNDWMHSTTEAPYVDTHCTVMTPGTLRLLLEETQFLGLVRLTIEKIEVTNDYEFYVRLKNKPEKISSESNEASFQMRRNQLLREIIKERRQNSSLTHLVRKVKSHIEKYYIKS